MSNGTLVWNEARDRGIEKWKRGEIEHGGDLYRKPCLDEAIDEAIDLIPYLMVHRSHVRRAVLHLESVDTSGMSSTDAYAIACAIHLLEFGNVEGETL